MSRKSADIEDEIISAIRRIVRAVDLQSRQLAAKCGVTGPQLVALRAIARLGRPSLSDLSREISIGQATLTGVIDRLERQLLASRERDRKDRRRVTVSLTEKGESLLKNAPPLLQEKFRLELARLEDWEQASMLATLQRIAAMMDAGHLDVAPILDAGPVDGSARSADRR